MANPASLAGFAGAVGAGASFAFKNRIINGDMRIDQRNAGASVTPVDLAYNIDRWRYVASQASKTTLQQNQNSVAPPTGFSSYMGITSSSAYTVGVAERFLIQQFIEGSNVSDLAWGTANAQSVTLSFWVRSSLTGTFGGSLQNGAGDRSYPFTYSINATNTWEYKTVTVQGDTTGTWPTNNQRGITVNFSLGTGSNLSSVAGSWAGASYVSATGATSVVGTNGATFYITGVQLEKGTVATPFEFRSIGQELVLCQRYYEKIVAGSAYGFFGMTWGGSSGSAAAFISLNTVKRALPTYTSGGSFDVEGLSSTTSSSLGDGTSYDRVRINFTGTGTGIVGRVRASNNANTFMGFDAEL